MKHLVFLFEFPNPHQRRRDGGNLVGCEGEDKLQLRHGLFKLHRTRAGQSHEPVGMIAGSRTCSMYAFCLAR